MQQQKQKLELTWIGKEKRPRLEPRVLVEDAAKSHHAAVRRRDGKDIFDNMLIHGDNLLALKALEQQFTGKVKCIYIDPPYNTGTAFIHYDDGLEHSIWLGLMRERLMLLYGLLSEDGSIWINLDDNEVHYCKVMCDELFGRENFLCDIAWEKRYSPPPDTKDFGYIHDHILVYRKSATFARSLLPLTDDQKGRYKNLDNDPRGPWKAADYTCRFTAQQRPNLYYPIIHPITGEEIWPKETRVWANSKDEHEKNVRENRLWWGKNGSARVPAKKNFLSDIQQGMMPMSLWHYEFAGTNQDAKKEIKALFGNKLFDTPKPEKLISIILKISTAPGDLVLDSFLGSGTTAAVAHKMGRRWIGVELGDHCYTHCKVRLDKVIDGTDAGGITKAVDWKGGGGYRFYELAPTLITKDQWGQEVINTKYNPAMLAEAVCKLEGYIYAPSDTEYFIHGHSTERSFIYVTTNFIRKAELSDISEQVGAKRSLLICCKGFEVGGCGGGGGALGDRALPGNVRLKKIPEAVLKKCEWGHDDYSLNVANLPMAQGTLVQDDLFGEG